MEQNARLRKFARYTSMNVMGTLATSCYILADTFFVAKGMGTNGLAALNLAIPVFGFINSLKAELFGKCLVGKPALLFFCPEHTNAGSTFFFGISYTVLY